MHKPIKLIRPVFVVVSSCFLFLMTLGFVINTKTSQVEPALRDSGDITICSSISNDATAQRETSVPIGLLPGGTSFHAEISSRSDSAKIYFDQGLLMYYSYHTQEAVASFEKAITFDSLSAILYWGLAHCYEKNGAIAPVFHDSAAAVGNIKKAVRLQNSASPFEADLITATSALLANESNMTNDQSHLEFENAMKIVYKKYPANPEAATFYALSKTWSLPSELGQEKRMKEDELELLYDTLLDKFPLHPGINHYFIHFIESRSHVKKGRTSAEMLLKNYGEISHLVHMASHIYIRTGNYREGIHVNEDAINLFDNYIKIYPPLQTGYGRGLYIHHARHMGFANAMMLSNDVQTQRIATTEADYINERVIKRKRKFRLGIQYEYMHQYMAFIRYGKWKEIVSIPELPDSLVGAKPIQHFSRGMAFARLRKIENARQELTILKAKLTEGDFAIDQGVNKFSDYMRIMPPFLSAVIAEEARQFTLAKKYYEEAIALEDSLRDDDPVQWYLPARQYFGNMYLEINDFKNAEAQFRNDLQRHPNNYWSLHGLLVILQREKKFKDSQEMKAQIKNTDDSLGPEPHGAVF